MAKLPSSLRRQLTVCCQWINSNFTNSQTLNLRQPTDDDVMSITSSAHSENIGQLDKQLASVVALSFDLTKHVTKFDGHQINRYPGWKSQWLNTKEKLLEIGRSRTQLLEELKKTLGYPALSFIQDLHPADKNLDVAETLLDTLYNDSQILVKQIVTQLLDLAVMKDNLQSTTRNISNDRSEASTISHEQMLPLNK